jgi:hypothetical protein
MRTVFKKIAYPFFLLLFTGLLAEGTLRAISTRDKHIDYLFGKKSYFLAPFHTPNEVPQVDTTSWFKYNVYDAQLGWSIGKLGAQPPYYSDYNGYRCSKQDHDSMIIQKLYHGERKAYDIVCMGNSFTHGDEVDFENTWPYQLEQLTGLATLNLGVGGYGIDQALLRYTNEQPQSNIVILGMVAGDLDRARTQIYNLTVGGLKTKPVFEFDSTGTYVRNQPTVHGAELLHHFKQPEKSSLLKRERYWPALFTWHWYDNLYTVRTLRTFPVWRQHRQSIYRKDGEDLEYCISILKEAQKQAHQNNARFVVLLLDNLNTFLDWDTHGNPWLIFISKLQEQGIEYWYYNELLYNKYINNPSTVINKGLVHYTPEANHEVAKFVRQNLIEKENEME